MHAAALALVALAAALAAAQTTTVRVFAPDHPDHNLADGVHGFEVGMRAPGIVRSVLRDGRPHLAYETPSAAVSGWQVFFEQWFATVPGVTATATVAEVTPTADGIVGVAVSLDAGDAASLAARRMVTAETHLTVRYTSGCTLALAHTDGDAWVYVDGRLCIDAGGVHVAHWVWPEVPLSRMGLEPDRAYDVDVFMAQRHNATRRADGTVQWALHTTCPTGPATERQLAAAARTVPAPPTRCRNGTTTCEHGGACVHTHTDGDMCACPPAWCGDTCGDRACTGHGVGVGAECMCLRGWRGDVCDACADGPARVLDVRTALAAGDESDATWSGMPAGRETHPENRVDMAHMDGAVRSVCAPTPDARYVLTVMPVGMLDRYMRGFFALVGSVPDAWLERRHAGHQRIGLTYAPAERERMARGPVLPGTVSRFDGLYYDCECRGGPVHAAALAYGGEGPLSAFAYNATALNTTVATVVGGGGGDNTTTVEWLSDALLQRTHCHRAIDVAERYEREIDMHEAHMVRLGVRTEIDSPRQATSPGAIVGGALLLALAAGGAVWAFSTGLLALDDGHPAAQMLQRYGARAHRLGALITAVVLNRDVE